MNSKKLITLLVLTTMILAMVPMVPVAKADLAFVEATFSDGDPLPLDVPTDPLSYLIYKGDKIAIHGDGVASGDIVTIYWDDSSIAWNGVKGKLNETTGSPDGSFEVWFKVPEAVYGPHYVWIRSGTHSASVQLNIRPKVSLSATSGLEEDKIDVSGYGLVKETDVAVFFASAETLSGWAWTEVITHPPYAADTKITGTLTAPVKPSDPSIPSIVVFTYPIPIKGEGQTTFTIDGRTPLPNAITVTAPTDTASFTAALYDEAGTNLLDGPTASTPGTPDTVALTPTTFVASATYMVKITLATETGDYVLADDGDPLGSGGPVTVPASYADVIDDGEGGLYYDADASGGITDGDVKVGTVNYVTGAFSIDYTKVVSAFRPIGAVNVVYDAYVLDPDDFYLLTTVGDSNALGSYVKRVTIPTETGGITPGDYYIGIMDAKGHYGVKKFKLGSVITLSKSEGPVGTVVRITGRGFDSTKTIPEDAGNEIITPGISLTDDTTYWKAKIVGYTDPIQVSLAGEFRIDIYIPDPDEKSEDYEIVVNDGTTYATAGFEVTAIPEITLTPNYGPQGSKFTVKGTNFVNLKDEEIYFYLFDQKDNDYERGVNDHIPDDSFSGAYVKVNSDGSFTKELRVPTQIDGTYDMVAIYRHTDPGTTVNMDAKKSFRVGTILVLLSEEEEASGRKIILSGNGFTISEKWNATFNGETLIDDGDVSATGLILGGEFFVPQIAPGTYDIVVTDVDTLITVIVEFTVTETTKFTADPSTAPAGYNITFTAQNWPEDKLDWEFMLYNVTSDGLVDEDWDITDDVTSMIGKTASPFMAPNYDDLEALGWWILEQPNGDPLGKGTYLLNITNTDDYYMQLELVICDEHISIEPRKPTFRIRDTVSFNIQHSFGNVKEGEIYGGLVKIYDPDDKLYWTIDVLEDWTKSGMYYYVPPANQVANTNPLILLDDAPLGKWTYKWYANKEGDNELLAQGSFNVAAAEADILAGQIEDLNQAIDDLTSDITGVADAVAGVQSNIQSAIQASNAAVDAANKAIEAVNAVAGIAGDAATAADRAAEAALKAQESASSLSTLVYGAIGASLVAALAAIVSLMQISKRIAG